MYSDSLVSITEAASILGVHPNTLRRWDDLGLLKSVRMGERGDRKYRKEDLKIQIQKGRNQFKGPRPKDTPHIGVGIYIFNQKHHLLMAPRTDLYGLNEYSVPGGRIVFGESPTTAAKKEVQEKVGIKVSPHPFCTAYTTSNLDIGEHSITIGFKAKFQGELSEDKREEWAWYSLDDLPHPIFQPCLDALECLREGTYYNF